MSENRIIALLATLGTITRLFLAFLPGFQIDVSSWFSWSLRLNEVGFSNFYAANYFSDYTPGYLYILSFLGYLRNLFLPDDKTFFLLLKLPAILSEVILGILVFKTLTKKSGTFFAILCSGLIFLNPAFIFNSSIWGQIDSVLSLFLFLSIYYLYKKRLLLSSFFLAISLLIKPQTIALFPLLVLFQIKNFNVKKMAQYSFIFLLTVFLISFPFFVKNPFTGLPILIFNTASQYSYNSLFAYNFWGMFGFWIPDSSMWNNLSFQIWGYLLLTGYWIMIIYFYSKKHISVYVLAALAFLGFYFLPTRVHERYLYPSFIFLIFLAGIFKSKIILILTTFLSFIHLLNLYYVYVYYNEIYLRMPQLLYNPHFYDFLKSNEKALSIISTIIFIIISYVLIKLPYVPKKA